MEWITTYQLTTRNVLSIENMDAIEKGILVALNVENC